MERTAITFEYDVLREAEFERRIAQTPWRYPYLVLGCGDRMTVMPAPVLLPVGRLTIGSVQCAAIWIGPAESGLARFLYTALTDRLRSMGIRNLYACFT
ncbi:GNAT family N-acetyltransferase [Megasphaera vaginalis (ex Srinivasan et al. 2021)]|uniref:GNAT family N-acetyltransferase n=1 Tax=Megasphaera vaginalis (ex Srinivasan et al. 2021) TaxID=1111454 RepID=UPI000685F3B0|nr:GNAT family N-acetyltransferase [Megasphaera vaginalis (ex Srinivasan et al. 2021)]